MQTMDSLMHFKGAISTERAIELANEIEIIKKRMERKNSIPVINRIGLLGFKVSM